MSLSREELIARVEAAKARRPGTDRRPAAPVSIEPRRIDWFEDYPCKLRVAKSQTLGCGCGRRWLVDLHYCSRGESAECTATQAHRMALAKHHREVFEIAQDCETCHYRSNGDSDPSGIAGFSNGGS